ncbi:MAG TPA: helix-turn-helix domain-containing protein [Candidatus Saccharimonadales bacterium]|nr:helix-turn-helix domain-containing protein [Candidatus Saccharimonadales bacterium]
MDLSKLIAVGLNEQQAQAYALLLENGSASPAQAAPKLHLSRTNAYKVFDKLVEFQLASKKEEKKKIIYLPANPMAISSLVAEQRNIATQREEAANNLMKELLAKYHSHTTQPGAKVVTGRAQVAEAYRNQIGQKEPIYFIRSRADIPIMGFDTMHEIRTAPARFGTKRFGINPDIASSTTANPEADKRSNLKRTWVKQEDYTSPVEWSVSGSTLLIVIFEDEPHAITIESPVVAEAFRQLWHIMDSCLRSMAYYKDLPRAK